MARSLTVPTATSFRNVPAKLLEVNRKVINGYRQRSGLGKVSFTHLIGYAIVRAIGDAVPVLKNTFVEGADGKPRLVKHDTVNLGLAVDVEKSDGSRTLVVPVIRDADAMDFAGFLGAYEELIRKVKANKLTVDDFQGATVSLTNPGTIGTVQSVPRLMPGQGVIVGVGSIDYPAEFEGADRANLSSLGISKVVTITSTYDHRIIQGAESGMFLKRVHELLLGEHGFYDDVFAALGMPYQAVRWRPDVNPIDREEAMLQKQMQVATLIRVYRVRGHLIADLDPLRWKEPVMPKELDPLTYGLTIWDLEREFLTGGVAGKDRMALGDLLGVLRDAYCRTIGIEYMHIQDTEEQRWIQSNVEAPQVPFDKEAKRRVLERLNAAEAFEKFLATKYVGTKRFGLEGAESAIPILDEVISAAADAGLDSCVIGMAHRGRLNVLSNIIGKSYDAIFREFEGHVDPSSVQGSGDVKYHLGASGKYVAPSGADILLELAANPSHLETVGPIVEGMVRARQDQVDPPGSYPVLPIQIHGDAAFAGQGVVAETLAMSDITGLPRRRHGAPDHQQPDRLHDGAGVRPLVALLQRRGQDRPGADLPRQRRRPGGVRARRPDGVRVPPAVPQGRRHRHVVLPAARPQRGRRPELHAAADVQGDRRAPQRPQAVRRGAREARRHHARRGRASARRLPGQAAGRPRRDTGRGARAGEGGAPAEAGRRAAAHRDRDRSGGARPHLPPPHRLSRVVRDPPQAGPAVRFANEAVRAGRGRVGHGRGAGVRLAAARGPQHPPGRRGLPAGHVQPAPRRRSSTTRPASRGSRSPTSTGRPARSGSTTRCCRSTPRSASSTATPTATPRRSSSGRRSSATSSTAPRSSSTSTSSPPRTSGASATGSCCCCRTATRGRDPEHSSARIERFLTAAAEDNMQICNATTAAQYFHLLRRQVHTERHTPLILFTPKQGLRMKQTRSQIDELTQGSFEEILDDPGVTDRDAVQRIVFCSGKVAWDAMAERDARSAPVAVVRVEQLYPSPIDQLLSLLETYPNARQLVWLQEEPENMGAWKFVESRVWRVKERGYNLRHVARVESGSPATGSKTIHDQELADLLEETFRDL